MAVDMFLHLDGVTGESKDKDHSEKIDVMSFSWGLAQPSTMGFGSGGGAGKVNVNDISIHKRVDKASPVLLMFCANGKHIAEGELIFRKAGENPVDYVKIKLSDILISAVQESSGGGEDMTENVSLSFTEANYVYTPQNEDGTPGETVEMTINVKTNEIT